MKISATAASPSRPPRHTPAPPLSAAETVILVHGLWTPTAVFALHRHWLRRRGYQVRCLRYPSVRATLDQNVQTLARMVATTNTPVVHLVGHSLGGLLILDLLAAAPDARLRRVVLLGTPCRDSHCARTLAGIPGLSALLGRSIAAWLARASGALAAPPSAVDVGVLAGTRSIGLGRLIPGLPHPNDGVVAVAETHLPGAADCLALPVAHAQMLVSRRCAAQIAAFLETGRFRHDE